MTWSTGQLAELANTTVNTVRHYHKVGLLPEPEHSSNGYKHYRVTHLVRLLQIRRLSQLGIPLSQIALRDRDETASWEEVRALDADLEATIDRLVKVRSELALVLSHQVPAETPSGFAEVAHDLSQTQRSMLWVYATIFDESTAEEFEQALSVPEETDAEFERLPADADDTVVEDLAQRMLPVALRVRREHPQLVDPLERSPQGATSAGHTLGHALVELHNPAQLRVLLRLGELFEQT